MTVTERGRGLELLGDVTPDDQHVRALAAAACGSDVEVTSWWVEPVAYVVGTPSTGGLFRLRGEATGSAGARAWSVFLKILQSPSRWEYIDMVPVEARDFFISSFPWRLEQAAHQSGVADLLPSDFRLPTVYEWQEVGDDRLLCWMEHVDMLPDAWDEDRFRQAAYGLGALAARRRADRVPALRPDVADIDTPNQALRVYVSQRVYLQDVAGDGSVWAHPATVSALLDAGEPDLRSRLRAAARALPQLLDRLDDLPLTWVHGDASPQNLLVARDDPDRFVVIDWGFDTPHAVGFDLGQLLVGLAHAGSMTVAELGRLDEIIFASYVAGLRSEGWDVPADDVRLGYVGSLVARSAFCALPVEELPHADPADPAVRARWAERARLTAYLLDRSDELFSGNSQPVPSPTR